MKNVLFLPTLVIALCIAGAINAQDFNTGSGFMNSGSAYSSTVTAVGSTGIDYSADQGVANRGRGDDDYGDLTEDNNDDSSFPIGSSAILFAFAALAAGVIAIRRRKAA